jgi:hypothetical protein
MLLRLTVALLLLLGVVMYGIGDGPDLDRTALAELRAEEQRALAPQVSRRTQSVLNVAVAAPAADPVVVPEPVATPDPVVAAVPEAPAVVAEDPVAEEVANTVVASLGATQLPEVTEPVAEPVDDAIVLYVTGRRVNLRAGPSTGAAVVGSVVRGQEVRLVDFEAKGWAQIRVTDLDQPVFMSGDFLSDSR